MVLFKPVLCECIVFSIFSQYLESVFFVFVCIYSVPSYLLAYFVNVASLIFSEFSSSLLTDYKLFLSSTLKRVVNHPLSYTFFFYFRVYWSELLPLQKYYIISFHSNDAAITKKCAFQRNDGLSHAHDKKKIIFL